MVPHGIGAVPDKIGSCSALPARASARSGRAWWNRAAVCAGASSEFWKTLRAVGRPPLASPEARGGVVPHGIGVVPDGIGLRYALPARGRVRSRQARWNRSAACAGASLEFCESSSSRREAATGFRRVARPLRRPGAAWCPME